MRRRSLSLFVALACASTAGLLPMSPAGAATPNDPDFGRQWGLSRIGAPAAWDVGQGVGVTIAVVDSGVAMAHPDLAAKLVPGTNFVQPGSPSADDHGHGTHVAGIAAAITFNGVGVAGTAPGASIMPIKVLDRNGEGTYGNADRAIRWAADNGARVINLSLGDFAQGITGNALPEPCAYAWSRGAICVAAAGNSFITGSGFADDRIVVVSATGKDDEEPTYSSGVGDAMWGIAAPGGGDRILTDGGVDQRIWSTIPSGYGYNRGTSMAAPHVSGALAILLGLGLSPQQAVDRILSTATDIGPRGRDATFGAGRLNLAAAVAGLQPVTTTTSAPSTSTTVSPTSSSTAPGGGGGGGATTSTTAPGSATDGSAAPRLAGSDRIDTAIAISRDSFPASAEAVVVARADTFPDALAGTPLAAAVSGPLLLSRQDALDERTYAEIDRVLGGAGRVHILGGEAAISGGVQASLVDRGYDVVRYAGRDRFETAARVAAEGLGDPRTFLLASGLDFQDALVAGAAAPRVNGAVLLTAGAAMPGATRAHIEARPGARRYAIGRAAAQADPAATAIAGADAIETSRRVAEQLVPAPISVGVASAATFADALGGGAHAARRGAPLLLTTPDQLAPTIAEHLRAGRDRIERGYIYGGPAALSDAVRQAVAEAVT